MTTKLYTSAIERHFPASGPDPALFTIAPEGEDEQGHTLFILLDEWGFEVEPGVGYATHAQAEQALEAMATEFALGTDEEDEDI